MSVLQALTDAIRDSSVEVIDLTAPLSAETPIIQLPEPFGNTARFGLTEISHYDERGPAWYWNDIVTGEHTGTHFDAPVHWMTGKDREDVAQVPVSPLIGAGKYGLTQLQNLARLPVTGAVVIAGPLPIVSGSGSPCRALALVERS